MTIEQARQIDPKLVLLNDEKLQQAISELTALVELAFESWLKNNGTMTKGVEKF